MTLSNKVIRDTVRAEINASSDFSNFTRFGVWEKKVNAKNLPGYAVGTPRWAPDLHHSFDTSERQVTLIVVVKRATGALEDLADADSDAIEDLVLQSLDTNAQEVSLTECTYQEDTSGDRPISTLSMMFIIKSWPANP